MAGCHGKGPLGMLVGVRRTKRFGRYHLIHRIGYGGMAEIFRGFTHDRDGFRRDVAIKRLLPHYVEDEQFVVMLTDEFKLVSQLRHPNVCEVFELARLEDTLFIAMEYVDGRDLRSTVEKAKRHGITLDFDDIAYVMARALDGLHYAHVARDADDRALNIVHRDFSPSNILLGFDGTVKICDFGIAKATHNRIQTKTGIIKGKVKYMSPEQAFGKPLDARSDIFSAGTVLYELCASRAPFRGKNEVDLIFEVREAAPPPCREVNRSVPTKLAAIVERAMSRSRSGRYQSALQFRDALLSFVRHHTPNYRRVKLSKFLKNLWTREIDEDLRLMEQVVLDVSPMNAGKNLIADALGPNAAVHSFQPNPSGSTSSTPASRPSRAEPLHQMETDIIAMPQESVGTDAASYDDEMEAEPTVLSGGGDPE